MRQWLNRPVDPRLASLPVMVLFGAPLVLLNALLLVPLIPLFVYLALRLRATGKRYALRSLLVPSMLAFPLVTGLWARSHQAVSYCLVSAGDCNYLGVYLFPGVIEVGYYTHDPAGLKYLKHGVTAEIADVMTDDVRRFQTIGGSDQVYDCLWFGAFLGVREVPVVDGWFAVGSIYAGRYPNGWTSSSFYAHSGWWGWGSAYSSAHVGFHFAVPALLTLPLFVRGLARLRRHERRLRLGLCVRCGYILHGLTEARCPECGTRFTRMTP